MIPAVVIASGPSLTPEDVEYCRGMAKVYVVNDCHRLAPWADALYACDAEWWDFHAGAAEFPGEKYTINQEAAAKWKLNLIRHNWFEAFLAENNTIALGAHGKNSGFQAMCLAAMHGHEKIILLGFDMGHTGGKSHWFGDHPSPLIKNPDFKRWIRSFNAAAPIMRGQGFEVINASRASALDCFKKMDLESALC